MGGRLGWLWAFVRAGSVAATPDATTSLRGLSARPLRQDRDVRGAEGRGGRRP